MKTIAIAAGLLLATGILMPVSSHASSADERTTQATYGIGKTSVTPTEARKPYSVKGQVIHAEDGSPAAYVTIAIFNTDKEMVAGTSTDENGHSGSIFAGAQYSFWKGCRIGANGGYFAPSVSLLGSGFGGYFYSLNLGKSFLDDRLNIDLNLSNFAEDFIIYKNTERTGSLISSNTMHYPARMLVVNISYRIGNFKGGVNRVRKSIVNDSFKDKGENGMQNMPGQKN